MKRCNPRMHSFLPRAPVAISVLLLWQVPALAEAATKAAQAATTPKRLSAPGGEVILGDKYDGLAYDRESFAPVRRSGDLLFISGIIVARRPGEGTDVDSFKNEVRRAFRRMEHELASAGATFDDVIMINSFHVWNGPDFAGSKEQQFEAFNQVKQEFMHGPHPAWTAVGSTGLLGTGGIVEVQMIAHAPRTRDR